MIAAMLPWSISGVANAQDTRQRTKSVRTGRDNPCQMTGAYRINIADSDRLYSVVERAASSVSLAEQQRFFQDLSVRLTPPDMLAIECRGERVSVGSSRAPKVTFVADGKTRRERTPGGKVVSSSVEMNNDTLTFTSSGEARDNVNVAFKSVDSGRRLRVTRRIYAEQLTDPIIIETVYDKVADIVRWGTYGEGQIARQSTNADAGNTHNPSGITPADAVSNKVGPLRSALNGWIDATNKRNIERQMTFYMSELKAFYLARNVTRNAVRLEKNRVFSTARFVDIAAEEPEIIFQEGDRSAIMRFRKKYKVVGKARTRSGEVVQELRWRQTNGGWRIFSERDVRVIR